MNESRKTTNMGKLSIKQFEQFIENAKYGFGSHIPYGLMSDKIFNDTSWRETLTIEADQDSNGFVKARIISKFHEYSEGECFGDEHITEWGYGDKEDEV